VLCRFKLRCFFKLLALSFFAFGSIGISQAAPFGVEMGVALSKLKVIESMGDDLYIVDPPVKNENFGKYFAFVSPALGVCEISAHTPPGLKDNNSLQEQMEKIKEQLVKIYGKHLPNEPPKILAGQKLMFGAAKITQREYVWLLNPKTKKHEGVEKIRLRTVEARNGGFIMLKYSFSNITECHLGSDGSSATGL